MKDKKMLYGIIIAFIFLLSIGLTYAYFSVTTNVVGDRNDIKATTMDLGNIIFNDGNEINGDSIYPGWSLEKTFTVENSENATTDTSYAIVLEVTENTLTSVANGAFKYTITGTSNNSGRTIKLVDKVVPATIGKNVLSMDGLLHAKDLHTYTFKIEFVETNEDQNVAQGKNFSGFLQIELVDDTGTKLWNESNSTWDSNAIMTSESCFNLEQTTYYNNGDVTITQIDGYYDYENNDETKSACPRKVNIPSFMDGYDVHYIAQDAFSGKNLEAVTIPSTVVMLYENSFKNNKITSVVIPDSVMNIAASAFENNYLTSVDLGEGVGFIGDRGFYNNSITSLVIPNSLMGFGSSVFENNKISTLTLNPEGGSIGASLFRNNELTNVVIPNSVGYIGTSAFENNKILSLTLGSGLGYVDNYAFRGNSLASYTMLNSSTSFGTGVFSNNKFTSVTISNTYSISASAYADNNLTTVTIQSPVATINANAFYNNKISTLSIADTVTSIGSSAFEKNQLSNVTIPSSVTTIDSSAFKDNALTSIIIPEGVINLGANAFSNNELTYACIKGKSSPTDFSSYDASAWTDAWASTENIIWNCTY